MIINRKYTFPDGYVVLNKNGNTYFGKSAQLILHQFNKFNLTFEDQIEVLSNLFISQHTKH